VEYAKTMSAKDVDEVIDYILEEVEFSVLCYDRTMIDLSFNSTIMILLASLCIRKPIPAVLNNFTELPSSCSGSLQTV